MLEYAQLLKEAVVDNDKLARLVLADYLIDLSRTEEAALVRDISKPLLMMGNEIWLHPDFFKNQLNSRFLDYFKGMIVINPYLSDENNDPFIYGCLGLSLKKKFTCGGVFSGINVNVRLLLDKLEDLPEKSLEYRWAEFWRIITHNFEITNHKKLLESWEDKFIANKLMPTNFGLRHIKKGVWRYGGVS